jgi:DNA polymerase III subunit delta'
VSDPAPARAAPAFVIAGQPEAERLLSAGLAAPSHAYLFHGPAGVGMDAAIERFAAALLGSDAGRVERRTHPDLAVVEPAGEQILIEQVRELRGDLHLRPFESERRVVVLLEAETLGQEAGNALLKSLEEPPPYVVFLLATADRARLLPTIESRCQLVRFRPLPVAAIAEAVAGVVGASEADRALAVRAAHGDLPRALALAGDPDARARRAFVLAAASDAILDGRFEPADAVAEVVRGATGRGEDVESRILGRRDEAVALVGTGRPAQSERRRIERRFTDQAKRARRRAETDEVRAAVADVTGFFRDVLVVAAGAPERISAADRRGDIERVAERIGVAGAERAIAAAAETREALELPTIRELQLTGLLHRLAAIGERSRLAAGA